MKCTSESEWIIKSKGGLPNRGSPPFDFIFNEEEPYFSTAASKM